ncbi:uncharacterized protein METZ01_LOCUS474759, partial [marine metagenome]
PNYGLRVDDHTSFIRGGNYSRTKLNFQKEGLLFGPYLNLPVILELGVPMLGGLQWTSSISTGLINRSEGLSNLTTQFNYNGSIGDQVTFMAAFNYMQEDNLTMVGVSGGFSYANFTWTFEADQAENWIEGNTSLAIYDELAWGIFKGIQLIGKYDYFDPKTEWLSGALSRYTLGIEIYPLNIIEIKLQVRINKIDMDDAITPDPEYLIQTHFWF